MLLNTTHIMATIPRLVIIPLFLLTCGLFVLPRRYDNLPSFSVLYPTGQNITRASSTFSPVVQHFWQDLAAELVAAQPACPPLELDGKGIGSMANWQPLQQDKKHPDRLVNFTDADETALFRAHYAMRRSAQRLGPALPFSKGTTGIVTTANAKYMPILLVSLRMLRKTGCSLPVEVFIDDWSKYSPSICETILPSLNARCIVLSNILSTTAATKKPDHYQYKIFALLFSSFQHVLFLDSDAFPAYDPTSLFTQAPYTTHSLVTWPDFWAVTASAHFYHIAAIPEEGSQAHYSTESGQLLLNKDVHRESLLLMVYYNYYGPDYYYILLCQGSHGAGDKETFVHAAMAARLPYHQVGTGPRALGNARKGKFQGIAIAQADPVADWKYGIPMRSHVHETEFWADEDVTTARNASRDAAPPKPRPFFLHQNMLKLDPQHVFDDKTQPTFDADGVPQRMWGARKDLVDLEYDVERMLWDAVAEEGCRGDAASQACAGIKEWIAQVFG